MTYRAEGKLIYFLANINLKKPQLIKLPLFQSNIDRS